MMNILFLNHNIRGQGTFIRCMNFAKNLVSRGHQLTILTSTPDSIFRPARINMNGVKVICMPDIIGKRYRNGGLGPIDTYLRCLYVFNTKYDIIENYDHRPAALYPAIVGKYFRKTQIVSEWTDLHGTGGSLDQRPGIVKRLIGPYENLSERKSKNLPAKLVVIAQALKQRAIELGLPADRIIYIPGGADLSSIKMQTAAIIKKKFRLAEEKKYIFYSAGTHYDADLLVDAVNMIHERRPDTVLLTSGKRFTKDIWNQFHYKDRIIQLGFLPYKQYADTLACADIFIFPFKNGTLNTGRWPNKIGDYMAAGRPIVSNPTGDIVPLFEKYKIGLLANENGQDFANKVILLLENEPLRLKLGQNARYCAETEISWENLAKRLENCFLEVLKENNKAG